MIILGIMIVVGAKIANQPKIFFVLESVSIIILILIGMNKKIPIHAQVNEFKILTTPILAPKSQFLKSFLRIVHGNGAKFSN